MPYGTWLERGEDGQFYEAEDEAGEDEVEGLAEKAKEFVKDVFGG